MMINVADATRHSEHVGRLHRTHTSKFRTAHFIKNGLHNRPSCCCSFSRSRRKLTVEYHSVLSLHRLTAPACLNVARFFHRFLEQFFQRVQFFTGNIMALTMGVAPTLFIKLNMRIIGSHYSVPGREGKWRCRSDSFRTPVTQVKVEIGCVKLAVH